MAKRAPADEKPYLPVNEALVRSVIAGSAAVQARPNNASLERGHLTLQPEEPSGIPGPTVPTSPAPLAASRPGESQAPERLTREKRVLLTHAEERQIERLVDRVGEGLRTSLKLSHVLRACVAVLCHAEKELVERAGGSEPLVRPPNGDAVALAQYEHELAKLISQALREAPLVR